ncbi:hypothetical protein CLOLEP_02059 [[Clostridium] leptum DSM 753]|uniref:Uncharacterized protein n=1 Tax=[Clostridium] leptum DSM 753 TaxID=428125 RepID=A7VU13_9FIRM|nr:hypothetical protein CLOLEP_02059 [[Clostridium] leptum DSM 753]
MREWEKAFRGFSGRAGHIMQKPFRFSPYEIILRIIIDL